MIDLLRKISPAVIGAVTATGAAIAEAIPPAADRAALYGAVASLLAMAWTNRTRIERLERMVPCSTVTQPAPSPRS